MDKGKAAPSQRQTSTRRIPPKSLKEAFGPASQAEMYLDRALEEFHHSANPSDLWRPVDAFHRGLLEDVQAIMNARNARLRFLRGAVLFAGVAAEALANELLDELLSRADAEALDRLPTPDKLLIGTELGVGKSPLSRGTEPLQGIVRLMRTRNALVHPKPQGGIAAWDRDVEPSDEAAVGPDAALSAVMTVAQTVVLCTEVRKHPNLHGGIAKMILRHRGIVERHQILAGRTIGDLPPKEAPGVPPLRDQMMGVVAAGRDTGSAARGAPEPLEEAPPNS